MQLGGSLTVTLTVPIAVPILVVAELPPQLTIIPATTKIAVAATKFASVRAFRAIPGEFMLLLPSVFSFVIAGWDKSSGGLPTSAG
jgi:hypothetical protein